MPHRKSHMARVIDNENRREIPGAGNSNLKPEDLADYKRRKYERRHR
jgi:hypothetical protein